MPCISIMNARFNGQFTMYSKTSIGQKITGALYTIQELEYKHLLFLI